MACLRQGALGVRAVELPSAQQRDRVLLFGRAPRKRVPRVPLKLRIGVAKDTPHEADVGWLGQPIAQLVPIESPQVAPHRTQKVDEAATRHKREH
eukprot:7384950-Prymnesium_polylepis.1